MLFVVVLVLVLHHNRIMNQFLFQFSFLESKDAENIIAANPRAKGTNHSARGHTQRDLQLRGRDH